MLVAELAELCALPDDALVTAQEASAFLRLTYGTLAWYRCQGGGPKFTRVRPKLIRYSLGDLREQGTELAEAHGSMMPRGVPPIRHQPTCENGNDPTLCT